MLCLQLVLEVGNILASSNPSIRSIFFVLSCLVDEGLHTLTVRALVFLEIHDVELVSESYN